MKRRLPAWARSVRVRLTVMYSSALFVIGALLLGGIYVGLSNALDDDAITRTVITRGFIPRSDGGETFIQAEFEGQFRTFESLANERALEQLRTWSLSALGAMFVLSLVVGWFVAGRVVRPIARISDVARDIQATDLSRRIDLAGPDDELTRLAETFDEMLARLDRAFEAQRRFVHEASHELRNPLATIRTNIEVALADPGATAEDLRQTAEVVDRTTERMGAVVDDLISFARSEMPEREFTLIDVGEMVEDVCEEFAGSAEANVVELLVAGTSAQLVRGDPSELRRVLANLVANAVEHSPSGSTVRVGVRDKSGGVRIDIADEGVGVSHEERDLVFRRGWRGDRSRDVRPSGSGLGLAIARQLVEGHGGSIWVETPTSSGARFVVELPAVAADQAGDRTP